MIVEIAALFLVVALFALVVGFRRRLTRPFLQGVAVVGLFVGVLALVATRFFVGTLSDSADAMTFVYGGAENLAIMRNPDRIQVYQLIGARSMSHDLSDTPPKRLGFSVLHGPVVADSILQDTLSRELTDSRKIKHYGLSLCMFEPDYLFSFLKDGHTIEILWSVSSCPEFHVYRDGEPLGMEEMVLDRGYYETAYSGLGYYAGDFRYLKGLLDSTLRPYLQGYVEQAETHEGDASE